MRRIWSLAPFFILFNCWMSEAQLTASLLNGTDTTTQIPETATGKLSQFKGYYSPRPPPADANYMYSSVWASWSSWSFCTGKVQVRVRACNTVRGYSCPGPNRETTPCSIPPQKQSASDYEDPSESDRKEAMKQLYADYDMAPGVKNNIKPEQEFRRQLSAGKTSLGLSRSGPVGPPQKQFGRQFTGHAPSMTPEQLYERKTNEDAHLIDNEGFKSAAAFASKNLPIAPPRDGDVTNSVPQRDSHESTTPPSIPQTTPFINPLSISQLPLTSTTTQQPTNRGDHVHLSSSVQQHFREPTAVGSVNEVKFRDTGNNTSITMVSSDIQEESLATALEPSNAKLVFAQRPDSDEIKRIEEKMDKFQVSGEAGRIRTVLHSGEVNFQKPIDLGDETVKALKWMISNMSRAAETAKAPLAKKLEGPVPNINLDDNQMHSGEMMRNALRRRVLAAKTLPNHRFGRERVLQRPPLVENPDEDQQLESELQRLQKNMQQMEGELEQLRKAEIEAQKPRFNIRKATNLNLVPKGPNPPNAPARAVERPSELFLLDDYKHRSSARWSAWTGWGECFCGKRIRTRNCIYDDPAHSEGCEGKSYETIHHCTGGRPCPNERKSPLRINRRVSDLGTQSTVTFRFQPSTGRFSPITTTEQPPHGNLFYRNPLPAINSK